MPCHLITQTGDLSREASEEMECRKLGGLLGGYIFGGLSMGAMELLVLQEANLSFIKLFQ